MIDTVRIKVARQFMGKVFNSFLEEKAGHPDLDGWVFSEESGARRSGPWSRIFLARHVATGVSVQCPKPCNTGASKHLNAYGPELMEVTIQASLPRVLFGQNESLIKTQEDLDAAIGKIWRIAGELLTAGENVGEFMRVDLVWHLNVPPVRLMGLMENAKHPRINRSNEIRREESVTFPGKEIRIVFYDKKKKEKRARNGDYTRVEIQIKSGKKVRELFSQKSMYSLMFNECYRVYRTILLEFEHPPVYDHATCRRDTVIAWCVFNGVDKSPDGRNLIDWAMAGKSIESGKKIRARIRKQIAGFRQHDFSFMDLLPETGPPEFRYSEIHFVSETPHRV